MARRVRTIFGRDWKIAYLFVLPMVVLMAGLIFWPFISAILMSMTTFNFQTGDTVQVGHCVLNVRHCPGHTPGHVVFHSPEARRAFVGDVLFAGGIGRTDFPGGNHAQLLASIRERLWPMGDDTVFIPGHGPESSFGEERRHNPFVRG